MRPPRTRRPVARVQCDGVFGERNERFRARVEAEQSKCCLKRGARPRSRPEQDGSGEREPALASDYGRISGVTLCIDREGPSSPATEGVRHRVSRMPANRYTRSCGQLLGVLVERKSKNLFRACAAWRHGTLCGTGLFRA